MPILLLELQIVEKIFRNLLFAISRRVKNKYAYCSVITEDVYPYYA